MVSNGRCASVPYGAVPGADPWRGMGRGGRAAGGFGGGDPPDHNGGYAPEVYRAAVFFVGTSGGFAEALERSWSSPGLRTIAQ